MTAAMTMMKWGAHASFLLAAAFIVAPLIYVMGPVRATIGPSAYDLADFLFGPVWGVSLVTAVFALRERIGEAAPRRSTLALVAAALSAAMFVAAALFRSTNRQYHALHPELHLESSSIVLLVWTTLLAGVTATGWHFLGWSLLMLGSAGWATRRLPRGLSAIYLVAGISSLFVYRLPILEGMSALLGAVWGTWQGILLWNAEQG